MALLVLLAVPGAWAQTRTVTILVPQTVSAVPLMLMAEENPVAGVLIEAEPYISHAQALALLIRGEAQFLLTGTSQGWENHLDGGPLTLVNTGIWGVSSLVGRDESIRGFADLAGRSLALPFPGAPLDFQTRYLLRAAGVNAEREVEISYAAPPQAVALLMRGQIDVAPLPEPLASNLVLERGLKRLIRYEEAWARATGEDGRSPQVSLFATAGFCRENPSLVRAIETAWREASAAVTGRPGEMAARFAETLSFPARVLEEAFRHTTFWVPDAGENRRRVSAYHEQVRGLLAGSRQPLGDGFFCPE